MGGLRRLCKLYGRLKIQGVQWVWDYEKDEPRKASDLTKEQLRDIQIKREQVLWGGARGGGKDGGSRELMEHMAELSQNKP